jgi:hypothetical protein
MITGFEVGALFKLVDEMSPGLRKILESMRELNVAIKTARESMQGFSGAISGGMSGAITQTNELAAAWERVTAASRAAAASARSGAAAAVGGTTAAVGGGGGFRPGVGGRAAAGGMHLTGPGVPIPGGSHARLGGTPGMVGAGIGAYSLWEASGMEKGVAGLKYHLGIDPADTSRDLEIRKILEEGMVSTGKDLGEVVESSTDVARQMRDTPGFDVLKELPRVLRAAQTEALSKGGTLKAATDSILGLARMVRGGWEPGQMEKLLQVFAYHSTANPASLPSMEKTLGYAIPILQSGADIPPADVMALSTVLATSGITSTKAGTWLRELGVRSMPGNAAHNKMLQRLGLLDENGKPTWFTNGRPDLPKALAIAGPIAAAMPPEERLPAEMDLFGRRGGGAFAILGSDAARERYRELRAGQEDPKNIARYNTFADAMMGTTRGVARSTLQEFNVAMIELGTTALPAATAGIKGLSAALGWFTGGHQIKENKTFVPSWAERLHDKISPWNWIPPGNSMLPKGSSAPKPQSDTGGPMTAQPMNFLQGPPTTKVTPITLSLNVDGRTLAQSMSEQLEQLYEHATGAPSYNEQSHFARADGGISGT